MRDFLLVVGVVICLSPAVYHFQHPEMTQMQMFLRFWWVYLIGAGVGALGCGMRERRKR